MKKNILFFISILFLVILVSCELTPSEEGKDVNRYIFPYVEFTLSEDGSYFTASVIAGATPEEVYIPSYVTDSDTVKPVRFFDGFKSEKGEKAVKSVVFESSVTVPTSLALKNSRNLELIKYEKIASENAVWESLYAMPQTEEEEFLGWFTESGQKVQNGDLMKSGSVKVYPKWGEHNYVTVEAKTPTCTTSGHNTYKMCSSCGYSTEVVWGAWGHNLKECETDGVGVAATIYKCSRCGLLFSDSGSRNRAYVYSISYDLSGGSLPEGTTNPSSYIRSENTSLNNPVTIKDPEKTNYTFKGWKLYGADDSTARAGDAIPEGMIGSVTLVAVFDMKIGSILTMGCMPEGADSAGEGIKWKVIDVDEEKDRALVFCERALVKMAHTSKYVGEIKSWWSAYEQYVYKWSESEINIWLNSSEETGFIKIYGIDDVNIASVQHETEVITPNSNGETYTTSVETTSEKIFLLSYEEENKYWNLGISTPSNYDGKEIGWLLRSPVSVEDAKYYNPHQTTYGLSVEHEISEGDGGGDYAYDLFVSCREDYYYVRPAFWLNY